MIDGSNDRYTEESQRKKWLIFRIDKSVIEQNHILESEWVRHDICGWASDNVPRPPNSFCHSHSMSQYMKWPHRMRWCACFNRNLLLTSWINHKTVHHYSLNYLSHLYWTCQWTLNSANAFAQRALLLNSKSVQRSSRHFDKWNTEKAMWYGLTVRFPRFFTLHTKWTLLPTKPVIFDGMVVSKYGPVPGVGYSCKKSVRKRRELPSDDPEMSKKKRKKEEMNNKK